MTTMRAVEGAEVVLGLTATVRNSSPTTPAEAHEVTLTGAATTLRLRPVSERFAETLRRLTGTPLTLTELARRLQPAEHAQLRALLARAPRWFRGGLVVGGRELFRLEPVRTGAVFAGPPVAEDWPVRLSKFSLLRTHQDRLVLESPRSALRVVPRDERALALLGALGARTTARQLAGRDWTIDQLTAVLGHLVATGLVETAADQDRLPSEADPVLRQWDFHDLLFHSRVRSGRFDDALGAVYPYRGDIDPLPAVKPVPDGTSIDLPEPDFDAVVGQDAPLTAVLEARRSVRGFGSAAIRLDQLGELCFRAARVRARLQAPDGEEEVASRPYPSGGGLYELEFYLTVRRCVALDPGIYYYDGVAHRLVLVNAAPADREAMLAVAARATGTGSVPDVLVTLTSRFQRLAWRYRSLAYATTLRNTGVVYQTLYLVATAMGLGGCGLGNGDADLAARVLGLDYYRESSVGDFMLGTVAETGPVWPEPDPSWVLGPGADWPERAVTVLRGGR